MHQQNKSFLLKGLYLYAFPQVLGLIGEERMNCKCLKLDSKIFNEQDPSYLSLQKNVEKVQMFLFPQFFIFLLGKEKLLYITEQLNKETFSTSFILN